MFISSGTTAVGIWDRVFFSGDLEVLTEIGADGEDTAPILIGWDVGQFVVFKG